MRLPVPNIGAPLVSESQSRAWLLLKGKPSYRAEVAVNTVAFSAVRLMFGLLYRRPGVWEMIELRTGRKVSEGTSRDAALIAGKRRLVGRAQAKGIAAIEEAAAKHPPVLSYSDDAPTLTIGKESDDPIIVTSVKKIVF